MMMMRTPSREADFHSAGKENASLMATKVLLFTKSCHWAVS
jgi:hypothetical protein